MQKNTSKVDSFKFIKKIEHEMNSCDFVICKYKRSYICELILTFVFVFSSLHLIIALVIALGPFFLEHAVKTRTEIC